MLAVLSPAKKLDFETTSLGADASLPEFQADANRLARIARKLSTTDLQALMRISPDLATLNRARFKAFAKQSDERNSKPAVLAFAGDTYLGLQAGQFGESDLAYAQEHLRILSGLYGLLRPLDRIQPYRLEMGSRLANKHGPSLYAYWGKRLTRALDKAAQGDVVINLASAEYFKAANQRQMKSPVVTPAFLEEANGETRMIGFFAKKARGAIARYMIMNRIEDVDGLKDFDLDGYEYQPKLSEDMVLVFTRKAA
jgi:uncharacterized protein